MLHVMLFWQIQVDFFHYLLISGMFHLLLQGRIHHWMCWTGQLNSEIIVFRILCPIYCIVDISFIPRRNFLN